jgi:hypothetical protein
MDESIHPRAAASVSCFRRSGRRAQQHIRRGGGNNKKETSADEEPNMFYYLGSHEYGILPPRPGTIILMKKLEKRFLDPYKLKMLSHSSFLSFT